MPLESVKIKISKIGLRHVPTRPKWRLEPKFHEAGTLGGFGKHALYLLFTLLIHHAIWTCIWSVFLRSLRGSHSKRKCFTVSLGWSHSGHTGAWSFFILLRCALSGMCCVLSLNIVTWSSLFNELIGSFLFGVGICANIDLPLSQRAQLFSLSILLLDFIICFAVLSETGSLFVRSLPLS